MASLTDSGDEDTLALALSLSQLSPDDFEEQFAQLPSEGSASANHIPRPRPPTSDEKDELALALRLSQLPSDDLEQVARLHRTRSASASEEAHSFTTPNASDGDGVKLALILSQLPADVIDELMRELNQRKESRTAIENDLASLLPAMSVVQVQTIPSIYLTMH
jgi:hypothetical protein